MSKFFALSSNYWKFLVLSFCVFSFHSFAQKTEVIPTDIATISPKPYDYSQAKTYKGLKIKTYYLTMRDSVKIAIDVYLPKGLEKGKKIPAIIHQTRYWRSPELRFPFKLFSNGLIGTMGKAIKEFVYSGYAIVNVDARGSGASFGNQPHPWHENETKDGAEIVDWIIKQEWSNQKVGSIGASYSGTTANFLLVNQHPNVVAIIDMYSLFDVYRDISFPGGIFHRHFVNKWGLYNTKLDQDEFPRKGFVPKLLLKGVKRVRTKHRKATFNAAIKAHEANQSVSNTSKGVQFRDDTPTSGVVKNADVFSPHSYMEQINGSGAAIYLYSGWFDGSYQYASIRKFLNYSNPLNKLTIGPWEHGGSYNCSPTNPSKAGFNHVAEYMKFFDYHLKGMKNGLYDEPKIHYFTMSEEKWKSSDVWPPESNKKTYYFGDKNSLQTNSSTSIDAFDTYVADTTVSSGRDSRWHSVIGELKTPHVYPNRKECDTKLLVYESSALENSMEITGHAMIELYINSTNPDGNFHVYLEEVDETGKVFYITEGLMRGIHRISETKESPYIDLIPYRSYLREDSKPMDVNGVNKLYFDLLPTSYMIPKGHKIRVSLAGADQDQFAVMYPSIPTWKVYHSKEYPSKIVLPVKEK